MARTIRPNQEYKDKLLKLIPTEIVGGYMVIHGILSGQTIQIGETDITQAVAWLVFAVLLILTPLYLAKIHKVTQKAQLTLTTIAFAVWAYTIGGPFQMQGWYQPQLAAVLFVLWTLIVPLVINPDTKPA